MFGRVLPANPTLADRFSWFVWVVINQMALEVRRRGMGRALETAMQRRILGLWKRLRSVLAQWEAGTLTGPRERQEEPLTQTHPEGRRGCLPLIPALSLKGEREITVASAPEGAGDVAAGVRVAGAAAAERRTYGVPAAAERSGDAGDLRAGAAGGTNPAAVVPGLRAGDAGVAEVAETGARARITPPFGGCIQATGCR